MEMTFNQPQCHSIGKIAVDAIVVADSLLLYMETPIQTYCETSTLQTVILNPLRTQKRLSIQTALTQHSKHKCTQMKGIRNDCVDFHFIFILFDEIKMKYFLEMEMVQMVLYALKMRSHFFDGLVDCIGVFQQCFPLFG